MEKDYVRIVYESEPIGEYKIRLILTTFDVEAYLKDQKKIQYKNTIVNIPIEPRTDRTEIEYFLSAIKNNVEAHIRRVYEPEIEKLKAITELMEEDLNDTILNPITEIVNVVGDIHCRDVNGHITNCGDIYCNTFKGVAYNCGDIIVKRNEEDIVSL